MRSKVCAARCQSSASPVPLLASLTPTASGSAQVAAASVQALARKPGALPGATALKQARAAGTFTATHEAWWAAARRQHGDAAGTRALIEVLLLHRHMPHQFVVAGIAAVLRVGALTADAVALEARKIAQSEDGPASGRSHWIRAERASPTKLGHPSLYW